MRWFGRKKGETPQLEAEESRVNPRSGQNGVRSPIDMMAEMADAPVELLARPLTLETVEREEPVPLAGLTLIEPLRVDEEDFEPRRFGPMAGRSESDDADNGAISEFPTMETSLSPEEWALHSLTPRERDVFDLLMQGKTLKQISECLGVKFSTVNTHYKSVYRKLDVNSRAEIILRYGLVRR